MNCYAHARQDATRRGMEAILLREHVPEHRQSVAADMVYFRLFEDGVSVPAALLHAGHFLCDAKTAELLPTTYAMLEA